MCGRYFFGENIDLKRYHEILSRNWQQTSLDLWKTGEVFPGNIALVLGQSDFTLMQWGYRLGPRLLINSRLESLDQYYRNDYQQHKCLILANGFYEWNEQKEKYYIQGEEPLLYLAALFQKSEGFDRFSIITKPASDTAFIHSRVPVILDQKEALAYLEDSFSKAELNEKRPVLRYTNTSGSQESLF